MLSSLITPERIMEERVEGFANAAIVDVVSIVDGESFD